MRETRRHLRVFISYASQDKPAVQELSRRLASERWIDPWVDERKLLPGQDWRARIEEAVETSDIVVICLSSTSVSKEGFVQKEVRYAREIALEKPEDTIFIIPLRLDECDVPRGLRFYQWADYFGETKDKTYSAFVESLRLRYEQKLKAEEKERAYRKKQEHEAAEKTARDKAEREAAEKTAREVAERETAEKVAREKALRATARRIAREKAKREAAERAKREKRERQAAQSAALPNPISKSSTSPKSVFAQARPFFWIVAMIGATIALFWGGSLAMPQLTSILPTGEPSATITATVTPILPTKTLSPTSTRTKVPTSTSIPTLTPVPQSGILYQEDFEDGKVSGWGPSFGDWAIGQETNGNHYWSGTGPSDYPQNWYGGASIGWTDYAFESRIQFVTGGTLFICIRSDTGTAFYAVYTDGSYFDLSEYNPSKNVQWTSAKVGISAYLQRNRWYTVRLEIKGSHLKTYVDNSLVLSHTLSTPSVNIQGGIGYYMGGGEVFNIDDIRVWSLE